MAKLLLNVFLILCCFTSKIVALECTEFQFECRDGTCIKKEDVCDGRNDCPDNSDELNCGYKLCKKPDWYKCADNITCISASFLCDDLENCPGGDDEVNCGTEHRHEICGKFEYTCLDKTCIPLDFMCDGKKDCPDNSDETIGCTTAEASCKGFFCKNRHCLESHKWVCDGYDDCGDGSDEIGCASNCKLEDKKFLCKDNDTCIALDKVCDGHEDCADKSDEHEKCNDSKNCTSLTCPQQSECHMLPSGPNCICQKGFIYDKDKNNCQDIDECQNYGICSHACVNTVGSFRCTCASKFYLKKDGRTCEARGGEPLLLYTTQKTVVGIYLHSRHMYKVAENLTQVIGVAYDGMNVYWTNIKHQSESIVRAREDGTKQEILLTSGLEAPEDLAVDWLTGNIYFSDNIMKHIAVCSNHGHDCTVLVVLDVDQPRGVALYPQKGIMFWSDWGHKPMIARASMDGHNVRAFVKTNIHWPNGVTLDFPNERLYWVDAKMSTIESINLDGSDRRVVLSDIMKHPYGISVFEDRIYWSDWGTKSVHSCHKFSGKHHEVVAKDRTIYAVHVYHSAIQPQIDHPCKNSKCSHLCLLAENNSSTCACPDGMALGVDQTKCNNYMKKQKLYLGLNNYLIEMEHTAFGRHKVAQGYPLPMRVHKMAYNSINGTIFIADNIQKTIAEFDRVNNTVKILVDKNIGNITAMSFDYNAQNLYWSDAERHTVEVLSLRNNERAIVHFFSGLDKPIALAVVPDIGNMYIALQSSTHVHIDLQTLHGRGDHHHIFEDNFGTGGIQLLPDLESGTLFWVDTDGGKIEFTSMEKVVRHPFRTRLLSPASMTAIDDDVAWSVRNSPVIYWTHKSNLGSLKKFEIEHPKESYQTKIPEEIPLLSSKPLIVTDHKCLHNNGGCSHVCVSLGKAASACLCPPALVFRDNTNTTCIEALDCEFRCKSGECLTSSRRCNGHRDCADGSDEMECESKKTAKKVCAFDEFACHDGTQCVENKARCDKVADCNDKSDEEDCEHFDHATKCRTHQYTCDNGRCIDITAVCDNFNDCEDMSDEKHCKKPEDAEERSCDKDMFKCTIGTCIPKGWECDGHLDCKDGSDEHEKCPPIKCEKGFKKCKLGQCIDEKLICDGHNDCGDNSDEIDCTEEKRKIVCGDELDSFGDPTKFQCPSEPTMCLDFKAKCNGTAECPRGEDEVGCSGCSIFQFECKTGKECIRKEFRCDKEKDCMDGSDEVDCQNYNISTHHLFATACRDGMFDCKDGTCIDPLRVCDGYPDCEKGEDETSMCKTACLNHSCAQKCTTSPYGAICSCYEGYKLNGDKRTCTDINECEDSHPCAQVCENSLGSYRCSCYGNFLLRPDKTSCKSTESEHYLLFSTFSQARMMSENPISLKVMFSANDSKITGLDVNIRNRKVLFTTQDTDSLFEYDLEKGSLMELPNAESQGKVAVDWITNNVYVLSHYGVNLIKVCNFKRQACANVIKFRSRDNVKAIAVDAVNRWLFYVLVESAVLGTPKSVVYKTGLDGSKREILLTKAAYIVALEPDTYKKELYFLDMHSKTLQSISYKDTKEDPKMIIRKDNAIINPSGLSIFENVAFIINTGSPEAVRCQLYGDKLCQAFNLNVFNAEDIVVVGPSRQKTVQNICESNKCSLMCVQAELGPKCICYDGQYVPEGVPCPKLLTNAIGMQSGAGSEESKNESSSNNASLAVCFSIMGIILLGLCGYIFYRRKTGRGNFNINMHFQNPLVRSDDHSNYQHGFPKVQMCAPFPKFSRNAGRTEISMDTASNSKTIHSTSVPGRAPPTIEISDNDSSTDVGNFEDDPRARLVI